jgi:ribonuclease-3 family protein
MMWVYPEGDPREMSPLILAYVGDAVYELYTRLYLVHSGLAKVKDLHGAALTWVSAASQAKLLRELEQLLSEEEKNVVKRGRNARTKHVPKHSNMIEYRLSTGFEALLGYLFLLKREERLEYLLRHLVHRATAED